MATQLPAGSRPTGGSRPLGGARVSLRELQVAALTSRGAHPDYLRGAAVGGVRLGTAALDREGEPRNEYGVSDQYLVLDSYERDFASSDPARGVLAFNLAAQDFTHAGAIGVHDGIHTVTEVQSYPFAFPPLAPLPYRVNAVAPGYAGLPLLAENPAPGAAMLANRLHAPLTQLAYGDRVVVELKEVGKQSVSGRFGRQHTFEFSAAYFPTFTQPDAIFPDIEPDRLQLQPLLGSDLFIFTDPITFIDRVTLEFRSVDAPIAIPADVVHDATARVDAGGFLRFTVPGGHNLVTGDRVVVEGLRTGDAAIDRYLADRQGRVVGNLDGAPLGPATAAAADGTPYVTLPTEFTLNPSVGAAVLGPPGTDLGGGFVLYFPKNRIRMPLRFRRIVDRPTQLIVPS